MTLWRRWVRRPQELLLRKVLFQIHLWTGIGVGAYVLVICVSGSVLVYRNELYRTFSPQPLIVEGSGESMTLDALKSAAVRAYPGYEVTGVSVGSTGWPTCISAGLGAEGFLGAVEGCATRPPS